MSTAPMPEERMLRETIPVVRPPENANAIVPRIGRVIRRRREAAGVWTLEFETDHAQGERCLPGQFNMLTVFGVGEVAISVSGDPVERARYVHTVRAVGAVSTALTKLKPGDEIGVRGPFGKGWPMAQAEGRDVVIVAGGVGLAPLRSALYAFMAERDSYGKIALLHGARSPEDILFRREMAGWRRRGIDVQLIVDHASDAWTGEVGVVTSLIPRAAFDPARAIALVCGPEVMMRFAIAALRDANLAADAIYLSMERNMKCAVGLCGHCQFGSVFVCKDGPVFRYDKVSGLLARKEI